jgi:hypothetical protein
MILNVTQGLGITRILWNDTGNGKWILRVLENRVYLKRRMEKAA